MSEKKDKAMPEQQDQLDMQEVRAHFPALDGPALGKKDWVFFDNAGGSQTLQGAIDRIAEFLTHRDVQIGGSYEVSQAAPRS